MGHQGRVGRAEVVITWGSLDSAAGTWICAGGLGPLAATVVAGYVLGRTWTGPLDLAGHTRRMDYLENVSFHSTVFVADGSM